MKDMHIGVLEKLMNIAEILTWRVGFSTLGLRVLAQDYSSPIELIEREGFGLTFDEWSAEGTGAQNRLLVTLIRVQPAGIGQGVCTREDQDEGCRLNSAPLWRNLIRFAKLKESALVGLVSVLSLRLILGCEVRSSKCKS